MTVQSRIRANAEDYPAYLREREHSRKLERLLSRATTLLDMECDRREARGEDVGHLRRFILEARG
jgi:hypothetical protein